MTGMTLIGFLLGLGLGWWRAGRLGGKLADKLQYAAGFGIGLGLLGLFLSMLIGRFVGG